MYALGPPKLDCVFNHYSHNGCRNGPTPVSYTYQREGLLVKLGITRI